MGKYEFDINPVGFNEQIPVSTIVLMSGGDKREYRDTYYDRYMVLVNNDGSDSKGEHYSVCLYPMADDLTTEYDTPYLMREFDSMDTYEEVLRVYHEWVHNALQGEAEANI